MNGDLSKIVDQYRQEIDIRLQELIYADQFTGLAEPMKYSATAPGKRIRPLLTLLTGEGLGVAHDQLLPAALAVELLHAFTLVHDDIMDNDTRRRGLQTVHVKWDLNTAILSGDGLMALAFRLLMQSRASCLQRMGHEFSQAMLEICEGQTMDLGFESRLDVTADNYLEMVGKKTGRLLGLCCQLGAMLSNADEELVENLKNFGVELGQAFQIQDDLLEITSDASNMGKSLDSDIVAGKKTYPLILMLNGKTAAEKKSFLEFLRVKLDNREQIIAAFRQAGVIDATRMTIQNLMDKALHRLGLLSDSLAGNLHYLVALISKRQH